MKTLYAIESTKERDSYHNQEWMPIHDVSKDSLYEFDNEPSTDDLIYHLGYFLRDSCLDVDETEMVASGEIVTYNGWAYRWAAYDEDNPCVRN